MAANDLSGTAATDVRPAEQPADQRGGGAPRLENGDRLTRGEFERQVLIRLGPEEVARLSRLFGRCLQEYPDSTVYLFGSRTRPDQRGGDVDLLVVSRQAAGQAYELAKRLRMAIKEELGEQRIDVVISPGPSASDQPAFVRLAFLEGVPIWP